MLFAGTLFQSFWKAYLIAALTIYVINYPFDSLETLLQTNLNILTQPGTYYEDSFRLAESGPWKEAWEKKMQPLIHTYPKMYYDIAELSATGSFAWYDNKMSAYNTE